jgi:glycosyl transferase family 2
MKLVMTLLVRDEEDIPRDHVDYHLNAGVDHVIAIDHRSQDRSTEILESYARQRVLTHTREEGTFSQQGDWQTHMSRLAATEHGADWVIPSDADEFWMPRGPSLKEALASVPDGVGVVCGLQRNFVPQRDDDGWFVERLTVRLGGHAPINDPATPFRPVVKVAHRGDPRVVISGGGAHRVFGLGEAPTGWYPLDILHFPFRSREQSGRKYRKTWTGWERNLRGDLARARRASDEGRTGAMWDRIALDEKDVREGIEAGSLIADVRLRDAFRRIREPARVSETPAGRDVLGADLIGSAVFSEAELVRLQRWLDDVHRRVTVAEGRE